VRPCTSWRDSSKFLKPFASPGEFARDLHVGTRRERHVNLALRGNVTFLHGSLSRATPQHGVTAEIARLSRGSITICDFRTVISQRTKLQGRARARRSFLSIGESSIRCCKRACRDQRDSTDRIFLPSSWKRSRSQTRSGISMMTSSMMPRLHGNACDHNSSGGITTLKRGMTSEISTSVSLQPA